jgi:hypothetical protein
MKPIAKVLSFILLLMLSCVGTGSVYAEATNPGTMKTIKLPSGEELFDVSGEWDVLVENYGAWVHFGNYPQVFKITQQGSSFTGIRLKDNPPAGHLSAGSKCMQGEVDKSGIKKLDVIGGDEVLPSKWQISEDGNKINVDAPQHARQTWTRK